MLQLSKKGREVYYEVIPIARRLEEELLRDLSGDEVAYLHTLLEKIESRAAMIPLSE